MQMRARKPKGNTLKAWTSVWRVAAKRKCEPSNVLQMCFICINCPHSRSSFRVYLHTLSVLTLQFRLSCLKLSVCTWMPMPWDFLNVSSDFFLPCTHSDTPVMFLKNWLTKKTDVPGLRGCCCRPLLNHHQHLFCVKSLLHSIPKSMWACLFWRLQHTVRH